MDAELYALSGKVGDALKSHGVMMAAAFEGIGHGAQLRLIATTNNVTIVHNDAIQLGAGTDYQMVANEVKLFFRSRDGVPLGYYDRAFRDFNLGA